MLLPPSPPHIYENVRTGAAIPLARLRALPRGQPALVFVSLVSVFPQPG